MTRGAVVRRRPAACCGVATRRTRRSPSCTGRAYDDWSLPKGKAKPGEHLLVTALREVAEETGHSGRDRSAT